ncbi:MAG: DNA-3-methyladenine glycosylase 2 family protein [Cytophagales bacterium]|nr:MAG: DNA-3-methyladenine glycosylase 2 family protein [Cytophagales bacterium]
MNSKIKITDPILEKIIAQIELPIINSTKDIFHDLMSCIIEQQIHYRSTKRIFAKALERANIAHLTIDNFHLVEKNSLPKIKLAMGKYETMMSFIEYWSNNTLDFHKLSDEEVIKELSAIKGIGKWTIDMILLYTLERPNIFPFDDFHLKQIMVALYNLDPNVKLKAQMLDIAEKWENQKSLAVLYLLAYKASIKKKNK